jgi:hypothetical protein
MMKAKELGKYYVVVFCKGCKAGFRVQEDPVPQGAKVQVAKAQTLKCPGCSHRAEYQPVEIRVARYQEQGLGRHRQRQGQ